MPEFPKQTYLGDGAYIEYDGQAEIILYTSNGIQRTNEVVLGFSEISDLCRFLAEIGLVKI